MTREDAEAEVERRRDAEPQFTWIASRRADDWVVVRLGVSPAPKPTATAMQPPPVAPRDDAPYNAPGERANWLAG